MQPKKTIVTTGVWENQYLVIYKKDHQTIIPCIRLSLLGGCNWLVEQKQGDEWVKLFIVPEIFTTIGS